MARKQPPANTPFSTKELAERWGCSQSHVFKLIIIGELHAINIAANPSRKSKWSVPGESVEAFEQSRTADELIPDAAAPVKPRRRQRIQAGDVIEFF